METEFENTGIIRVSMKSAITLDSVCDVLNESDAYPFVLIVGVI